MNKVFGGMFLMAVFGATLLFAESPSPIVNMRNTDAIKTAEQRSAVKLLKQSPEWIALESDYDTLTNRLALYDADYMAATNAIAVTTGTTKTALTKVLNVAEDNRKALLSTKQCIQDLKRLIKGVMAATPEG